MMSLSLALAVKNVCAPDVEARQVEKHEQRFGGDRDDPSSRRDEAALACVEKRR